MSTLYLVATPIGNLEDISARALRVLREVNLIAAEDTRHSGKLLKHFEIQTKLTSYYDHNKSQKLEKVLAALDNGDVALISDAGTPGLNDPGYLLVRAALEAGHKVSPIPGPSAPIAALVASGLPTDKFLYMGYLPRKSHERQQFIKAVADHSYTLIFLESPHRLQPALEDLHKVLGPRQAAVASELTKMYEDIQRGTLDELSAYFENEPARGEFTLVVSGASQEKGRWSKAQLLNWLQDELNDDAKPSSLARQLAKDSGWPRREVYDLITELQKDQKES
ncbi:MAG: 16S rRNA (cytidine(1402)-2'-O)-methyltransferase [Chloroflexi bacterium]|nr:MAG: 16S rRNA (cytidine(1402)-2'-O)-methyltransferase [Chloroflexota bacterium]MBL1196785.1 16S rRNA (cytidine(1402)-2'-O)-methyltransferase [Chloroflexota bacterium]NOH14079.1 16S rRNA (cytidine(1402)-2'-O)-methyltransferase [Chloroflexota bacterium]